MVGWIKLHRKFADWGYYNNSQMVHLFIHLLINANFEDKGWNGIIIKRGQCVTGLLSIHNATGISIQSTRTLLKKLENTKEISVKSTNKYSIITICKYDDYQFENDDTNKQSTNNQQTINKQSTTTKEIEEVNKDISINNNNTHQKPNFKKPTIEEVKSYCSERRNKVNPNSFLDFYESKGWLVGKTPMKDWKASIRNWERNSNNNQPQSRIEFEQNIKAI